MRLQVLRGAEICLNLECGFGTATVLAGEADILGQNGRDLRCEKGESMFLPNRSFPINISSQYGLELALTMPPGVRFHCKKSALV